MKKLLFVYNPHAGKEALKPKLSDAIDIFVKAGYEVTIYPTQESRDAYRKVKEYNADDYELVVCSGGDGTIDEVVTGMMGREEKDPIGYIPAGTVNDFASSLYIPKDVLAAADNAVHGVPFSCDIGKFNDGVFVYIAAFGLFTDVSYETNQDLKNVLGHLAYLLEGAKRLLKVPSYQMKITHDEGTIEGEFFYGMVTNSRSVGGVRNMIGKDVVFDDGLFEVTLIKKPKSVLQLQEIIASLLIEQINTEYAHTFRTSKITFESVEEVAWTLDGEYGGHHTDVVVENAQKAVQIMVPEDKVEELMEKSETKEIAEAAEVEEIE